MVKRTSWALLACLILAELALGQEPPQKKKKEPWVGARVVTRYARPLKVDERVVDDGTTFRVYNVDQAEGGSLRLVAGGVKGWVATSDVVRIDEAVDFYTAEIRENPDNASAHNWRGLIWREKGEPGVAIADFDAAIRINPNDPHALNNRGNARLARREYDLAIADYDAAIRLRPDHAMAYNNRGNTRLARKDYDLAIADYDQAIRLDPKSAVALNNRGAAWRSKGDHDRALADFEAATRIDPKFSNGYNRQSWLRATCPDPKFRDGKKAIELARKACDLSDWKNAEYLDTLAAAHAEAGVFDQAVRWQREAIDRKPPGDDEMKAFQDRLALYRARKPYREP